MGQFQCGTDSAWNVSGLGQSCLLDLDEEKVLGKRDGEKRPEGKDQIAVLLTRGDIDEDGSPWSAHKWA